MVLTTLYYGTVSPLVRVWQLYLQGQGHYNGDLDFTFGRSCYAATQAYQRKHNLREDISGQVGDQTWGHALLSGLVLEATIAEGGVIDESSRRILRDYTPHLRPLGNYEMSQKFGSIVFDPHPVPGNAQAIRIKNDFVTNNIIKLDVPWSKSGWDYGHRGMRKPLERLITAWTKAKLMDRVISYAGMWVPRYSRAANVLSEHSWGTAFDINAQWNWMRMVPAQKGEKGSVRELVPIAEECGFYWRGFSNPVDGMHFVYVRDPEY